MKVKRKRIAFHTLGCKLNFTETSMIARSLDPDKFERVEADQQADIYIINTCTVTESADRKCRQSIKKIIKQAHENACIVVVGCYAQLKPDEITSIKGVDLVLGVNEKFSIGNWLDRIEKQAEVEVHTCDSSPDSEFTSSFSIGDRTRSFLKVQDGCDYKCSYCTVPLARGISRNQSIKDCVNQAILIEQSGAKEIVLTGVNIGDFGKSTGESFYDLLRNLISINGIIRYRISSIEPDLLSDEIISLVASEKGLAPHFHMPLQSGSNEILSKMKRRYNRELFSDRVNMIRKLMPYASIGADIIVGFPGESDKLFNDTYSFLEECDISYIHSFSYSPRPGTAACELTDQIDKEIISARSRKINRLSEKKRIEFYRKCCGKRNHVIWEKSQTDGYTYGYTGNYIRTRIKNGMVNQGDCTEVQLTLLDENGIFEVSPGGTIHD